MSAKTNPCTWFEIPVSDLDRAEKFYAAFLGAPLQREEMGPMQMAWILGEQGRTGAFGSLVKSDFSKPSADGSVVFFEVDSIEKALETIEGNGGKTIQPKTSIGEFGFIAHFLDCEGNRVALHSES